MDPCAQRGSGKVERIRDRVQAVPVDDGAHGLGTPEHTGLKRFRSGEGVGHGRADLSYVF
jgi:hypothetical protein